MRAEPNDHCYFKSDQGICRGAQRCSVDVLTSRLSVKMEAICQASSTDSGARTTLGDMSGIVEMADANNQVDT